MKFYYLLRGGLQKKEFYTGRRDLQTYLSFAALILYIQCVVQLQP